MNEIIKNDEIQTLSSMEVAQMVEKKHSELLKDIRRYAVQLAEGKIPSGDFFSESTYLDANNQSRKCYLVTKKGCEFIAHKLTGQKGTEFTARYINRFHEMEDELAGEVQISAEQFNQLYESVKEFEKQLDDIFNCMERRFQHNRATG